MKNSHEVTRSSQDANTRQSQDTNTRQSQERMHHSQETEKRDSLDYLTNRDAMRKKSDSSEVQKLIGKITEHKDIYLSKKEQSKFAKNLSQYLETYETLRKQEESHNNREINAEIYASSFVGFLKRQSGGDVSQTEDNPTVKEMKETWLKIQERKKSIKDQLTYMEKGVNETDKRVQSILTNQSELSGGIDLSDLSNLSISQLIDSKPEAQKQIIAGYKALHQQVKDQQNTINDLLEGKKSEQNWSTLLKALNEYGEKYQIFVHQGARVLVADHGEDREWTDKIIEKQQSYLTHCQGIDNLCKTLENSKNKLVEAKTPSDDPLLKKIDFALSYGERLLHNRPIRLKTHDAIMSAYREPPGPERDAAYQNLEHELKDYRDGYDHILGVDIDASAALNKR